MHINLIDLWRTQALLLDLIVIIGLLVSLKYIKGALSSVSSQGELVDKNNAAFGISYGGGILALGIVLSGVSSGEFADSLLEEALSMAFYGILGLVLVLGGRLFQDKIVLSKINIHSELAKNNLACALVDVGHMLAIGLIIRATMIWVPTAEYSVIPILLLAFVLSQIILTLASIYRVRLFASQNKDHVACLQTAVGTGLAAVALRYAGFTVGVGLMVTAISHLIPFDPLNYWRSTVTWAFFSILALPIYSVLVIIVRKLVLPGVNIAEEVDRENNVGIAAVETGIFLAISTICVALL